MQSWVLIYVYKHAQNYVYQAMRSILGHTDEWGDKGTKANFSLLSTILSNWTYEFIRKYKPYGVFSLFMKNAKLCKPHI